jgi:hypothetical protein
MSSHERPLSLWVALMVATVLGCCLPACSSNSPSEDDAVQALNARNARLFKVKSLRKTDGKAIEAFGVKAYEMDYEAEIECTAVNSTRSTGGMPGFSFGMTPAQCYEVGQTQKIKGTIGFEKTENGWRATAPSPGNP